LHKFDVWLASPSVYQCLLNGRLADLVWISPRSGISRNLLRLDAICAGAIALPPPWDLRVTPSVFKEHLPGATQPGLGVKQPV